MQSKYKIFLLVHADYFFNSKAHFMAQIHPTQKGAVNH